MAQHDYVLDNQSGASYRQDNNNALLAIVTQNSASGEPSTTYQYQMWMDENNNLVKQRNSANNAWVTVGTLGAANWGLVASGTAASTYLPFSGGTITGTLEIGSAGSLRFEGSTANDHETTLAVVDPTADRTITFPNDSGTVPLLGTAQTFTAAQRGQISTLTSATGVTPDFAVANNFSLTMGHTVQLNNPSNLTAGQSGAIYITQPASGSTHTMSFGGFWDFAGGNAPSLSTANSAVDVIVYAVRSTTSIAAAAILNIS